MEQGEWFNALEYRIEGRGDGTSVLRYVHSGIFMDDWDAQYDAVQQHTDFYLHTLGQYLEFFDGQPATYIGDVPGGLQGPARSTEKDGFDRLKEALGLDTGVGVGTKVNLAPKGLSPVVRRGGLRAAQLPRHPHLDGPLSILRAERVRSAGRHVDPHVREATTTLMRSSGSGSSGWRVARLTAERTVEPDGSPHRPLAEALDRPG